MTDDTVYQETLQVRAAGSKVTAPQHALQARAAGGDETDVLQHSFQVRGLALSLRPIVRQEAFQVRRQMPVVVPVTRTIFQEVLHS